MMDHRNLYGYGEHPPHADWPGGARVAVSLVLNIEEGSERAVSRGDEVNEPIYDMIQDPGTEPDLAMESHFDYGSRAGYWRIARVLRKYDATCTLNICAEALERTPWIAEDGLAHGYEFGCHGDRWMSPAGLSEREEAAMIARAVGRIRKVAGVRPVGWHSRSPCTANTRRLLVEEGGIHLRQRGVRRRSPLHRRGRRPQARGRALQPGHQRHALPAPRFLVRSGRRTSPTTSSTRSIGYGRRARRRRR